MSWNAPIQVTTGQVVTSAFWNAQIYDNFRETAPFKAGAGFAQLIVKSGTNQVRAVPAMSEDDASSDTTTSTTYTAALSSTIDVDVPIGASPGFFLVFLRAKMSNSTAGASCFTSFAVTGDGTQAASDDNSIEYESSNANDAANFGGILLGAASVMTTPTMPGTYTFTMVHRVSAGTGTFSRRQLIVIPLM